MAVARVLAGAESYDGLAEREQAMVRQALRERLKLRVGVRCER